MIFFVKVSFIQDCIIDFRIHFCLTNVTLLGADPLVPVGFLVGVPIKMIDYSRRIHSYAYIGDPDGVICSRLVVLLLLLLVLLLVLRRGISLLHYDSIDNKAFNRNAMRFFLHY